MYEVALASISFEFSSDSSSCNSDTHAAQVHCCRTEQVYFIVCNIENVGAGNQLWHTVQRIVRTVPLFYMFLKLCVSIVVIAVHV